MRGIEVEGRMGNEVDWVRLEQVNWVGEKDCAKGKTCSSKITSRNIKDYFRGIQTFVTLMI